MPGRGTLASLLDKINPRNKINRRQTVADSVVFEPGGYRYEPSVFQYSAGVAAEPGYALARVRFRQPLPMAEAFAAIEALLKAAGRPTTAFAACELRSPDAFTDQGVKDFNRQYVTTLERWGLFRNDVNPVARTNVCPAWRKPAVPSMAAFSYTVPSDDRQAASFVLSGGGDARPGSAPYSERIIRLNDTSPEGLREKVSYVISEMERRLKTLGFDWADATSTQAYTVHNIGHLVGELLAERGAIDAGLVWVYARPPVIGLEYEMDVRGLAHERVV